MPHTNDPCGCPTCPPGTPLWHHLAAHTIKREKYLQERFIEVSRELERAHLVPPPGAEFRSYRQHLLTRPQFLPTLYLSLTREYFSIRDELREDFVIHILSPEKDQIKDTTATKLQFQIGRTCNK